MVECKYMKKNIFYVLIVLFVAVLGLYFILVIGKNSEFNFKIKREEVSGVEKDSFVYLEKDQNLLLLDVIANNDLKNVKKIIESGVDINHRTKKYWIFVDSHRRRAVLDFNGNYYPMPEKYTFYSDEEIVREMDLYLDDIEQQDELSEEAKKFFQGERHEDFEGRKVLYLEENSLPLELACKFGYLEVVKYLLDRGAEYTDKSLFITVKENYPDALRELLKNEREINIIDLLGDSPLSIAAEKNYIEIAEILINNGADISFSLGEGAPNIDAFDVSVRYNNPDIVNLFLGYKKIDELWKREMPVLHWVIYHKPSEDTAFEYFVNKEDNRIKISRALLESGVDINQSYETKTPLVEAIILSEKDERKIDIINFLIKQGADVNFKTEWKDVNAWSSGKTRYILDLVKILEEKYPEENYDRIESILESNGAKTEINMP